MNTDELALRNETKITCFCLEEALTQGSMPALILVSFTVAWDSWPLLDYYEIVHNSKLNYARKYRFPQEFDQQFYKILQNSWHNFT